MQPVFNPEKDEEYLNLEQLADRWRCHQKTAQRRAKQFNVPILLLGGQTLYPVSAILEIERGAVASYARRVTKFPPQFEEAREKRRRFKSKWRKDPAMKYAHRLSDIQRIEAEGRTTK